MIRDRLARWFRAAVRREVEAFLRERSNRPVTEAEIAKISAAVRPMGVRLSSAAILPFPVANDRHNPNSPPDLRA